MEAYRLLRSTAYQLHLVIQQNLVVQELVTFFSSCGVSSKRAHIKMHEVHCSRFAKSEFITHCQGWKQLCIKSNHGWFLVLISAKDVLGNEIDDYGILGNHSLSSIFVLVSWLGL